MDSGSLHDAFEWASDIVNGVDPAQLSAPTTCDDWTVRMLLNHMIGAARAFAAGVPAGDVSPQVDPTVDLFGDDPGAAYDSAWPGVIAAWEAADPEGTTGFPWGPMPNAFASRLLVLESTAHGWDLATSTGQDATIPDGLARGTMELATAMLSDPAMRGHDFKPAVDPGDHASPTARLVGFLGRQP